MSHFSVLVIGDDYKSLLAPFHEFESTGEDDEFVQDIDVTEDLKKEFETDTTSCLKDPDGGLHSPYDDRFYRSPTTKEGTLAGTGCGNGISWTSKDWGDGRGYRAKVRFIPKGWEEVDVPANQRENFLEWIKSNHGYEPATFADLDFGKRHKYGYALLDKNGDLVKVIKRTNPKAKWDFHLLGGSWAGFFKMKPGKIGVLGKKSWRSGDVSPGFVDRAQKGDIDFSGMEENAVEKAIAKWEQVEEITSGISRPDFPSWDYVRDVMHKGDIEKARKTYNTHPFIVAINKISPFDTDRFLTTKELYIKNVRDGSGCPFAFIKDGQWCEKGEMGWFATVSNEKDPRVWQTEFRKMLDALPDDAILNIVDCHI